MILFPFQAQQNWVWLKLYRNEPSAVLIYPYCLLCFLLKNICAYSSYVFLSSIKGSLHMSWEMVGILKRCWKSFIALVCCKKCKTKYLIMIHWELLNSVGAFCTSTKPKGIFVINVWIRIRNKTTVMRVQPHSICSLKDFSKHPWEDSSPNHVQRYF